MERIFTDERKNEKERNNSPWRACFPRAVVILLYIFIFFDIADADGGGAGMGTDGDADGPNFIHHIEAFCQEGLAHFFYGGMAFLFPTHQQYAIEFLFAADFVSCHIHDGFERFFMPAHLAFGIQFAIAHDDNRLDIQNRACQSGRLCRFCRPSGDNPENRR